MPSTEDRNTVLITGVSGRIGRRVAEVLAPSYRVIGLDKHAPDEHIADALLKCDLTDEGDVRRTLEAVRQQTERLASVIHLAAYYDFSGQPSPLYDQLTVEGTRRMLRGLSELAFDVEQFVFSSSLLVMKPSDGDPIDEASELRAEWDYPQSKIDAEDVIENEHGEIPAVILRIAGCYDDAGHSIPLSQQAHRIYEKKLEGYLFPGNPEQGQTFVHIDDVATCFARVVAARNRLDPWEVFLVGEPDIVSYAELQDRIGEILHGEEWPTIRVPAAFAKAGAWLKSKLPAADEPFIKPWMIDLADANYPITIARARDRLGWEPRYRLRDHLVVILDGLEDDPAAWYEDNGLDVPDEAVAERAEPNQR